MSILAAAHSFLFVPANRPDRFIKALASGADAVIIDLEDAVAPADKVAARHQLALAFAAMTVAERSRVVVRINALGTVWYQGDLLLLQGALAGLAGVMVPKAETVSGLMEVASAVGPSGGLLPLVETVAGLDAVNALAGSPQVTRLAFGNLDFQADLGMACGPDESELISVRMALVLASRRAGRAAPVDGVTPDIDNSHQLHLDASRAQRGGFGGKLCIHPTQVVEVNAVFSLTPAQLNWAARVIASFEASGGGVVSLDGHMIDAPVVRLAQQMLAKNR